MKYPRRRQRHERAIETPRNGLLQKMFGHKRKLAKHFTYSTTDLGEPQRPRGWRSSLLVCEKHPQKVRRGEPSEALHEAAEDPE